MPNDLEQNANKQEDNEENRKLTEGFLVSLLTGVVSGLAIDCPGKFELSRTSILAISAFSGITLPFLLRYDTKENIDYKKTFKRNPYYFSGMLAGLTIAKTINHYFYR